MLYLPNYHLRDAISLFADEAFFAGDNAHIGTLNALITEPTLTIEGKGRDVVITRNFLHIWMASNNDWVIPASGDARRYFMLNVPDTVKGDKRYFKALDDQMNHGGYEAMLYDLLRVDLTNFDHRTAPQTDALQEQRQISMATIDAWWLDALHREYVYDSKIGLQAAYFGDWHEHVSTDILYASYLAHAKKERRVINRAAFGAKMLAFGGKKGRPARSVIGEEIAVVNNGPPERRPQLIEGHKWGFTFGNLAEARKAFEAHTKMQIDWGDTPDDPDGSTTAPAPTDDPAVATLETDPLVNDEVVDLHGGGEIIMDLLNHAIQQLGGVEQANEWMEVIHPKLAMKPADMCMIPGGYQKCLNVLLH